MAIVSAGTFKSIGWIAPGTAGLRQQCPAVTSPGFNPGSIVGGNLIAFATDATGLTEADKLGSLG
jgi:hypothetical protein